MKQRALPALAVLLPVLWFMACKSTPTTPQVSNHPPKIATYACDDEIHAGRPATFRASGYDPDGSVVSIHFGYWPAGHYEDAYVPLGYMEYVPNNTEVSTRITFPAPGQYSVCCHCVDAEGAQSTHRIKNIVVLD